MEFGMSDEIVALRKQIREIIAETVTPEEIEKAHDTGTNMCRPLYKAMGEAGLIRRAIPGIGKGDPLELFTITNELEKASAPYDAITMVIQMGAVISRMGSEELKAEVLPTLMTGESLVCFGMTEPDAGSDLPNIQTRAVQDGDDWIINGSKVWTTMAHVSDWAFMFTRTGEKEGGRAGYTTFFIPMDTPGIRIEPIWTVSTERSNSTFFDDVRIPSRYVIGEPNKGWATLSVMLSFERGMGNTGSGIPLLRRFAGWAEESGAIEDPLIRDKMAQVAINNEVSRLLTQKTVWRATQGDFSGVEGSIAKVFATEAYQYAAQAFQAAAGPAGIMGFNQPRAAADGWLDYDSRHSIPQTFQGGTSEINRNNIAERHLGLPRTR
jgi:alkylation response protein AidB-like acyl-CoA dehydrogenase